MAYALLIVEPAGQRQERTEAQGRTLYERMLRQVGLAEEFAQDALVSALEQWPRTGVPDKARRLAHDHREEPGAR